MKKFSAARQDFCRAAGFLPEPPRFGRSVTDFPSFQLFPTFRPFGRRFSNVSAVRPPFLTFWPCERRFRRVLADLHRNLRDRGARVTFTRFGRFPVSAVRPPFSRRLGRATTVFPASWPICTVTYVIGVPGSRFPVFPRFGRFPPFRPFGHRFLTFRPCERGFRRVLADLHRNLRDRGARGTFSRFPPFRPFGHRFRTFRPFGHRFRTYRPFRPPFSNVSAAPPPFPHVSPLRTPFSQCLGRCAP